MTVCTGRLANKKIKRCCGENYFSNRHFAGGATFLKPYA
jgi:hypothetical protein